MRYVVGIDLGTTNSALAHVDLGRERARIVDHPPLQLVGPGEAAPRPTLPSFLYLAGAHELPAGAGRLPWSTGDDEPAPIDAGPPEGSRAPRRASPSILAGEYARTQGMQVPARLVSSAKSWLCHPHVDRLAAILPWGAAEPSEAEVRKLSPVAASAHYLRHLAASLRHTHGVDLADPEVDVILCVPASFDEVARELTLRAAALAGLPRVSLLEEPQAAFYAWLAAHPDDAWQRELAVGDQVLVFDVGGGTTDFSLIAIKAGADGKPTFERTAVGDHLLLGGDNMDLALARRAETRLARGGRLDPHQFQALVQGARLGKERLLAEDGRATWTVTVAGRGSRLVGGTLRDELTRAEVEELVLDGFFPRVPADARPERRAGGIREFGLPYAADAAITRHLADFLRRHDARPTAVLWNGGVLNSVAIQARVLEVLRGWHGAVRVLPNAAVEQAGALGPTTGTPVDRAGALGPTTGTPVDRAGALGPTTGTPVDRAGALGPTTGTPVDRAGALGPTTGTPVDRAGALGPTTGTPVDRAGALGPTTGTPVDRAGALGPTTGTPVDLAVARGAAYFGLARLGRGLRIGGGAARAYYLGVDTARVQPGELSVVTLTPRGLPEGAEVTLREHALEAVTNRPVRFRLFSSSDRSGDAPGQLLTLPADALVELEPIYTVLRFQRSSQDVALSVNLHARLTEIGTLELECVARATGNEQDRWRLNFDLRAEGPKEPAAAPPSTEAAPEALEPARELIRALYGPDSGAGQPAQIAKQLSQLLGPKDTWSMTVLRSLWEVLKDLRGGRGKSPQHEARWLNLVGYCLRPGVGYPLDDWRVKETWRLFNAGVVHDKDEPCRLEWWILWRRVSGGLTRTQQDEIWKRLAPHFVPSFAKKSERKAPSSQEAAEMWRTLASMERLPAKQKAELGDILLGQLEKKNAPEHAFWALGRLGARVPLYGPIEDVVAAKRVDRWLTRLLTMIDARGDDRSEAPWLAAVELARCSGDRARDLDEHARKSLADRLRARPDGERQARVVQEPLSREAREERLAFGDALPSGVRWLSDDATA